MQEVRNNASYSVTDVQLSNWINFLLVVKYCAFCNSHVPLPGAATRREAFQSTGTWATPYQTHPTPDLQPKSQVCVGYVVLVQYRNGSGDLEWEIYPEVGAVYCRSQRSRGLRHPLGHWDRGFGSHLRRLFCVCAVLCAGSDLATVWSPVQGVLPSM
jgi:hypothetical protein